MLTSVQRKPNKYTLGECYRLSQSDRCVDSLCPTENLPPARAVVRGAVAGSCSLIGVNSYAGTLNADMVSGGTAQLVGYTETPAGVRDDFSINVPFNTNQATTATDIKTAIEAAATDVLVTISNSNRTFTVTSSNGKRLVITTPFTRGGTGTATFTNVKSSTSAIRGISERDRSGAYLLTFDGAADTLGYYRANKSMAPIIYRGDPVVLVFGTVTLGATPYVVLEDYTDQAGVLNPRGSFRGDTDGGLAPVVPFTGTEFSGLKDAGMAPISILKV